LSDRVPKSRTHTGWRGDPKTEPGFKRRISTGGEIASFGYFKNTPKSKGNRAAFQGCDGRKVKMGFQGVGGN